MGQHVNERAELVDERTACRINARPWRTRGITLRMECEFGDLGASLKYSQSGHAWDTDQQSHVAGGVMDDPG